MADWCTEERNRRHANRLVTVAFTVALIVGLIVGVVILAQGQDAKVIVIQSGDAQQARYAYEQQQEAIARFNKVKTDILTKYATSDGKTRKEGWQGDIEFSEDFRAIIPGGGVIFRQGPGLIFALPTGSTTEQRQ